MTFCSSAILSIQSAPAFAFSWSSTVTASLSSGQTHGTSEHDSCVPCAYIDAELAQVILMWTLLSTNEKAQILAVAREQTAAA